MATIHIHKNRRIEQLQRMICRWEAFMNRRDNHLCMIDWNLMAQTDIETTSAATSDHNLAGAELHLELDHHHQYLANDYRWT